MRLFDETTKTRRIGRRGAGACCGVDDVFTGALSVNDDRHASSNVVAFPRARRVREPGCDDEPPHASELSRLIDLSRYEAPPQGADDFRARMGANVAALVLLAALIAAGTIDVIDLEDIERCAPPSLCASAIVVGQY
jgi:hypothetical protein